MPPAWLSGWYREREEVRVLYRANGDQEYIPVRASALGGSQDAVWKVARFMQEHIRSADDHGDKQAFQAMRDRFIEFYMKHTQGVAKPVNQATFDDIRNRFVASSSGKRLQLCTP